MSSTIFFFMFIPFLAFVLLLVNFLFAPHNPYQEKESAFECGFHSFLGQNRTQFSISFFIFALLFLLFDLEILLVYPYIVSAYSNSIYGLLIMLLFFTALTIGLGYELGKKALNIDSRQKLSRNSVSKASMVLTSNIKNPNLASFSVIHNNFDTGLSTMVLFMAFADKFLITLVFVFVALFILILIHKMPMPGVRCPNCAARGVESWVLPGKDCNKCGCHC